MRMVLGIVCVSIVIISIVGLGIDYRDQAAELRDLRAGGEGRNRDLNKLVAEINAARDANVELERRHKMARDFFLDSDRELTEALTKLRALENAKTAKDIAAKYAGKGSPADRAVDALVNDIHQGLLGGTFRTSTSRERAPMPKKVVTVVDKDGRKTTWK